MRTQAHGIRPPVRSRPLHRKIPISVLGHGLNHPGSAMTAPLKAVEGSADLQSLMNELGERARAAARVLALAPAEQKNRALEAMERAIRASSKSILAANSE